MQCRCRLNKVSERPKRLLGSLRRIVSARKVSNWEEKGKKSFELFIERQIVVPHATHGSASVTRQQPVRADY